MIASGPTHWGFVKTACWKRRVVLRNTLEAADVEFIDENGGGPGGAFAAFVGAAA